MSSPRNAVSLGALEPDNTVLFVCDIQEKFSTAMLNFDKLVSNTKKLVAGCGLLGVPAVVTEQYPKGLGHTVPELGLADCGNVLLTAEKTQFNMLTPEVVTTLTQTFPGGSPAVVLCGIETHVCVEQTAAALLSRGCSVHLVQDCCSSRTLHDRATALQRMAAIGCHVTTYEAVLFKLLGSKDHPKFKELSQLVREKSHDLAISP